MNKKFYYQLLAILLTIVFVGSSFGPASAKPGCTIQIAVSEGSVPLEITYEVKTSIPGDPMVIFGDKKPNQIGRTGTHLYEATGEFIPKAIISEDGSLATTCRFYSVKVHPVSGSEIGLGGGMNIPEEEFEAPQGSATIIDPYFTVDQISKDRNGMAENAGENAFSVVNTGEGDIDVRIEQAPVPVVTPTPTVTPVVPVVPDNSCSGYCASSGGTININPAPAQNNPAVKTMPTSFRAMFFYTIFDGISSPFENWKTWLVENR